MSDRREESRDLTAWVDAPLDDTEIAAQWSAVRARRTVGRRRTRVVAVGALAAAAALVLALVSWWVLFPGDSDPSERLASSREGGPHLLGPDDGVGDQVRVDSGPAGLEITLADGSRVALRPHTRLTGTASRGRIALVLGEGGARFDVTHVPDRPFVVATPNATVRVVGTSFSVALRDGRTEVLVHRGVVQVSTDGEPPRRIVLRAGETWSTGPQTDRVDPPQVLDEEAANVPRTDETPVVERRVARDAPRQRPPVRPEAAQAEEDRVTEATALPPERGASAVMDEANHARREGRHAEAAARYQELVRDFPEDPRAPVASYELGRIYLDSLGQPAAAIAPFSRTVRTAPRGSSYREDALARLTVAYARVGQPAACARRRAQYLREYPRGVHAATIREACGSE